MSLSFCKLEGCGNHFVVTHDTNDLRLELKELAPPLLDPNYGIGGDGLMVIAPCKKADFEVQMYNPDGSAMGMCGNGVRCVVRYLYLHNLLAPESDSVTLAVEGRTVQCFSKDQGRQVRAELGEVSFDPAVIPINSKNELIDSATYFEAVSSTFKVTALSIGNPHAVIFSESIDQIDLDHLGPAIENDPLFPARTNVEFVEVVSRERLKVRVWERGAGATLACGSGACASLAAAARNGLAGDNALVELPGGALEIEWNRKLNRVYLTGPAREVYQGQLCAGVIERMRDYATRS
ncbi:MAG: diaminopimelate epimerase [Proteobacteria bacterium]|nr:MAG: diaminopimelate epimerase [Pseudomonadota bacterium]